MRRAPLGTAGLLGLLLLALPAQVRAGVGGALQIQGQGTWTSSQQPGGIDSASTAALLQENLSLHYAGLPFGPSLALITLGGELSNYNSSLNTGRSSNGRSATLDFSAGLLPRRSYPLRVYARANVSDGDNATLAQVNTGPNVLYGATMNLEPGRLLPALRVNVEELRSSSVFTNRDLADVRRSLDASTFRFFGAHQVQLNVRANTEERDALGSSEGQGATLSWTSPRHQSQLLATRSERSAPDLSGLTSERQAAATHYQAFSERLNANTGLRYTEAAAGGARGDNSSASLGVGYSPFRQHQLTLSAGADASVSRSRGPEASFDGRSYGGTGRAAYSRQVGPVLGSLQAGVGANDCDCGPFNSGLSTVVDTGIGLGSTTLEWMRLSGDYNLSQVFAPASRGGDRIEHRANAQSTMQLPRQVEFTLSLGLAEGQRELLDITSGQIYRQRERSASAGALASTNIGRTSTSAEVRHARGEVVIPTGNFVVGAPPSATATTQASLGASTPFLNGMADANARLIGSWTSLQGGAPLSTYTAFLGWNFRFGRFSATADYQFSRYDVNGLASYQHLLRTTLSRPFDL